MDNLTNVKKEKTRKETRRFENGISLVILLFGLLLLVNGCIKCYVGITEITFSEKYKQPIVQSGALRAIFGMVAIVIGIYRFRNARKIISDSLKEE